MPSGSTLLSFVATAIVFCVVPGPNVLYIVSRALAEGRRVGLASVLGVNTASVVHIGLAALGLSALLASSALAYDVVRYAGAAYLVFLGVRALLRSRGPDAVEAPDAVPHDARADAWAAYRQGFVVNLLSPKTALFFLALLPQFVDPARGSTAVQVLVLGFVLLAIGAVNDSLYALGAGALAHRLHRHGSWLRVSQRVSALVYIALGLGAAFAGGRRSG